MKYWNTLTNLENEILRVREFKILLDVTTRGLVNYFMRGSLKMKKSRFSLQTMYLDCMITLDYLHLMTSMYLMKIIHQFQRKKSKHKI